MQPELPIVFFNKLEYQLSPCATIELELVQPSQTVTEEPITPNLDWTDLPKLLHHIIAYHRIFALVGGSAQAGIFLSQAYYWTPRANNPEGWFYKTKEEWEKETGLTRRQQDTVVKHLKELGILSVELRGIPCKLYYKINKEVFAEAIGRHQPIVETGEKSAETTQNQQLHKNAELNPLQNHTQQAFQPHSEITSENTTKNTQISAPPDGAPEPRPDVCVNNIKQEAAKTDNQPASSEVEKPFVKTDNLIIKGFQPGKLITLAGRPAMGKSSMLGNMALNAARNSSQPVILFSTKMTSYEWAMRYLSQEARVEGIYLESGRISNDQWKDLAIAVEKLSQDKIYIDDSPKLTLASLRSKVKRMVAKHGKVSMVGIDYLQLMTDIGGDDGSGKSARQIGEITRQLKLLARECNTTVVLLSQLNRGVESRNNKTTTNNTIQIAKNFSQ